MEASISPESAVRVNTVATGAFQAFKPVVYFRCYLRLSDISTVTGSTLAWTVNSLLQCFVNLSMHLPVTTGVNNRTLLSF